MTHRRSPVRVATALAIAFCATLGAASCSSNDTEEVTTSPAPAPTAPAATQPATTASPTIAETTAAPATTEAAPKRSTFDGDGPFDAGPYRATRTFGPRFGIDLELPADGLYGSDSTGDLTIALDAMAAQTLVMVLDLEASVMMPPVLDDAQIEDLDYMLSVSSATPDDLLAWFTERPGVSAVGPAETVEFGGYQARRQTFEFGPFDGGVPCFPDVEAACHVFLFQPASGYFYFQFVGDVITVYQLAVGSKRVAVVVDESAEPELARAVADSIEFLEY